MFRNDSYCGEHEVIPGIVPKHLVSLWDSDAFWGQPSEELLPQIHQELERRMEEMGIDLPSGITRHTFYISSGLEALAESLNILEGSQDKDSLKVLTELPRSTAALPRHGKGSWDEEKKEKVQGEMSSKELVKTRFFSTGHGVKLEGSMNYAKGKSWALLLSIYKWSRQRAPLEQKAASCKHYSKSSELRNKSEASRARTTATVESAVTHKYLAFQKKRLLISTNANGDHRSRRTSETAIELIKK
ncbi:hypothetical protein Tco_0360031 [Tanacetum coccineum]